MGLFSNPAKDAKVIQDVIDYRILKAAWDSYAMLSIGSLIETHRIATPAWFALFAIQNYQGDFKAFDVDEIHLLKALADSGSVYEAIIAGLESSTRDENLARHILNSHPNLVDAVPKSYDNVGRINEYIVLVLKKYVYLLQAFYKKYQKKIDSAIANLEAQAASKADGKFEDFVRGGKELTETTEEVS